MIEKTATDLLSALAPLLRVRPIIDDYCQFGGQWSSPHEPSGRTWAQFHIVTRGACLIERAGQDPIRLSVGDVLLFPHGDGHVVRSKLGAGTGRMVTEVRNAVRARSTVDAKPDTELLCGRLQFEAGEESGLIAVLPDMIVLHTADQPIMERFRALIDGIREEVDAGKAAADIIASDLARALFLLMIRLHIEQDPERNSLMSLLQNPLTSRVLVELLREPARDWTLDDMAKIGITSRATLVRVFRKACGVAPITFLQELRLTLAKQRLVGTSESISRIAAEVGYQSEGALSRALQRRYGIRPGALRSEGLRTTPS